jgi:hypothetical protein
MTFLPTLFLLPTIWVVDAQMGPGAHFANLPAAIAAAANGDTILVRAGDYAPFSIQGKFVTIRGEGSTKTRILGLPSGPAARVDLPGGMTVISGLRIEGGIPSLQLQNAAVELLDCEVAGHSGFGEVGAAVVLLNTHCIASRCTFQGGAALGSAVSASGVTGQVNSTFLADQCFMRGGDVVGPGSPIQLAGFGVWCLGRMRLDGCRVRGGATSSGGGLGIGVGLGSTLRIVGDVTSYVAAGFGAGQTGMALQNLSGTAFQNGPITLVGSVSGTLMPGPSLPRLRVVGTARADGTLDALQSVQVTLDGLEPNGFGFVAFGDPVFAAPAPPFASELLVGGAGAAVFVTALDATGRAQFAYTPALIGGPLVGVPVHLQGGAWSPVLGSVLTSNLAVHIAVP